LGVISFIYETVTRRKASEKVRRMSVFSAIWRKIRKWLCVVLIPNVPFNALRVLGYRLVGFKIGKRVFIGMKCYLDDVGPEYTVIEDDVTISYRATFACHGPRMENRLCTLREGCYIGANAMVLGGVEIGPYASVGACALVTKSIPAFSLAVGVPAKVIRTDMTPWKSDEPRLEELKRKVGSGDSKPPDAGGAGER